MGVTISENLSALVAACILTVTGAISIGESTPAHIDLNPSVSDSVAVGEDTTAQAGTCNVSVSDSITVGVAPDLGEEDRNVEASDSISLSEDVDAQPDALDVDTSDSLSLSESIEVTPLPIGGVSHVDVSDSVAVGESGTIYWNFATVYITESVEVYIYTPTVGTFNTAEFISVSEFIKSHLLIEVNVSDEVIVGRTSIYASDSVAITEEITTGERIVRAADSVSLSELVNAAPSVGDINVSDSIAITESASGIAGPNINVSDSIATGESTSALVVAGNANVSDSMSVADVVVDVDILIAQFHFVEAEESISVGETISVTPLILPFSAVEDSVSLTESIIAWIETTLDVSESISIGESTEATLSDHAISVSDLASISESVNVHLRIFLGISDSISTTESVGGTSDLNGSVSDSISVVDSVVSGTLVPSVSQAISVSESVSVLLREKKQEIDLTLYLDTAKGYNFSINTAENITLHIKRAYSREFIR